MTPDYSLFSSGSLSDAKIKACVRLAARFGQDKWQPVLAMARDGLRGNLSKTTIRTEIMTESGINLSDSDFGMVMTIVNADELIENAIYHLMEAVNG